MFSKPVPDFAKGQCDHCASPTGAAPTQELPYNDGNPGFARHDLSGDPDSVRHDVSGISDAYKTSLGPAPKPKRKRHDTLSSAALALYDRGIKPFDVGLILAGMSGIDEFQPYFEPPKTKTKAQSVQTDITYHPHPAFSPVDLISLSTAQPTLVSTSDPTGSGSVRRSTKM